MLDKQHVTLSNAQCIFDINTGIIKQIERQLSVIHNSKKMFFNFAF